MEAMQVKFDSAWKMSVMEESLLSTATVLNVCWLYFSSQSYNM